jgi:hypothetical protein
MRWASVACLIGALALVVLVGCIVRWRGQEVIGVDPDADVHIFHPHGLITNAPDPGAVQPARRGAGPK